MFAPLEHKPLDDRCLQSLLFPSLVFFAGAIGFALWLLLSNWRILLLVFQNVRDRSIHSRRALGLDAMNVDRDYTASGILRESRLLQLSMLRSLPKAPLLFRVPVPSGFVPSLMELLEIAADELDIA